MRINEIILLEKKKQTRKVYHGTSSIFLKTILKNGLLTTPPTRTYDSQVNNYSDPAEDTFSGGVYLTPDKKEAIRYAEESVDINGGDPIIIEVEYVIGSEEMDEDSITRIFKVGFPKLLGEENFKMPLEKFIETLNSNYSESKLKFLKLFRTPQISRISDKARQKLIGMLFDYIVDYFKNIIETNPDARNKSIWLEMGSFLSNVRHDPKFENILRALMKQMSPNRSSYEPIRIPRNIGFSGKTKIKSIYSAYDNNKIYYEKRRNRFVRNTTIK